MPTGPVVIESPAGLSGDSLQRPEGLLPHLEREVGPGRKAAEVPELPAGDIGRVCEVDGGVHFPPKMLKHRRHRLTGRVGCVSCSPSLLRKSEILLIVVS